MLLPGSHEGSRRIVSDLSREEVVRKVAEQCAQDPEFRPRLLADPRTTIAELIGMSIPDTVTITVHEESLTDVHLVLPHDASRLTEDDLALASGGWDGTFGAQCAYCNA